MTIFSELLLVSLAGERALEGAEVETYAADVRQRRLGCRCKLAEMRLGGDEEAANGFTDGRVLPSPYDAATSAEVEAGRAVAQRDQRGDALGITGLHQHAPDPALALPGGQPER